jgi:hypothetical protein
MSASVVVFAIAVVAGLGGIADAVDHATAERVPSAVQRQLPLEYSLGNLCRGAQTPRSLDASIRRQVEVLLRELKRRPDALVTFTYEYEDRDAVTKNITIRTLAEAQLSDLKEPKRCAPALRQRLVRALEPK